MSYVNNRTGALSKETIEKHLKTTGVFNVEVRETVTSTNTLLREMAAFGAPEGYVLVANEQTAGKGRMGREFFSPASHGIYFSLLLRPQDEQTRKNLTDGAALITSAAAVATAQAIETVTGVHAGIKWVNDLYISDKKVCGILTEANFNGKQGYFDYAVLGIGINVTRQEEGFTGALKEVACSIEEKMLGTSSLESNARSRIVAAILDNFWSYYNNINERAFLDEYRSRSIILGRDINVQSSSGTKLARAVEIDNVCGLVVKYNDGKTETLRSGEVSVRLDKLKVES